MKIRELTAALEAWAPPALAESYDNVGLLTGDPNWELKGAIINLDVTEEVVEEAVRTGANLIVAHHPIWFTGRKRLNGEDYVSRTLIAAIKNDVAIYAIHTNLDNVNSGVNKMMADRLGLKDLRVLSPSREKLMVLSTEVPEADFESVREALFRAGAGRIGNYAEASFVVEGETSFKPLEGANPAEGNVGERAQIHQKRLEVMFPHWSQGAVVNALVQAHPYEMPAYRLGSLVNPHSEWGSGMIGVLEEPLSKADFLAKVKEAFGTGGIRYADAPIEKVRRVALCGGSGSFLTGRAMRAKADAFVTADITYHKFFDNEGKMLLLDIGHYESEQFTSLLILNHLSKTFPNFAIRLSEVKTNPVKYY